MPSHIVAYPSVTSSLHNLQYATNINNVPLHAGPHGRAAESEELLKKSMSHSGGGPHKMPVLAALPTQGSSRAPHGDMLTMRDRPRKIHT